MAVMGMVNHSRSKGIDVEYHMYGNALLHSARNKALASIRADADYALLVDDDMLPESTALVQMLEYQADNGIMPVVSGLCTTRLKPVVIAAKVWNPQSEQFVPLDWVRENKVITGQFAVGAAFLLMTRAAVDRMVEYYLSARDWLDSERRLMDRLHVRAENREKERARKEEIRRARYASERLLRVFDFPVNDAEQQLGEDIAFSLKLIRLGIPTAIDARFAIGHVGEYPYGVWDLEDA